MSSLACLAYKASNSAALPRIPPFKHSLPDLTQSTLQTSTSARCKPSLGILMQQQSFVSTLSKN
eukprot:1145486-Pelagomonas_calceolata.AAC.6